MIDNFKNSGEIQRDFATDPVLQQLLLDAPVTGARYRGIRVEAVFTPESEITTNAEKYNGYTFACIISVNDMHYAVGQIKDIRDSVIVSEIDHSVTYDGKVIFTGIA
jgi:hypothetical protein